MSRKVLGIVLLFAAILFVTTLGPALAKNFNDVPAGAVRNYWTGGSGTVAVPLNFASAPAHHYETLSIYAQHVEDGTYGTGDSISVFVPYGSTILPLATFCTNANEASFEKTLRSGTPAGVGTNTRSISESNLKVERQGNNIIVELKTPQAIMWPKDPLGSGLTPVTIPAFTMELNKVGGSLHTNTILQLTGFIGASGYTVYDDNMGFNGNGAFTCPTWSNVPYPMTNCHIVMHGIKTNAPP